MSKEKSSPDKPTELDLKVRGQKIKIGWVVLAFSVIEVGILVYSVDYLGIGSEKLMFESSTTNNHDGALEATTMSDEDENAAIDSGVIQVILFAIPFMLVTNVLVLIAILRDNVWLLLPWMVLHCVVIAFLALGAAILSAHGRGILGSISLLGAIFFLLCWKGLRQLFMKMVDRQLKDQCDEDEVEQDEESMDIRHRHEQIFFGSKDRKFYHKVTEG